MEVKVDVRKLQLLSDRINQTIEALNQVRMSVHGLSHTTGLATSPFAASPVANVGYQAGAYGQIPVAAQQQVGWATPPSFGLQHTPGIASVAGTLGYQPFWGGAIAEDSRTLVERQLAEQKACDPVRIQQNFPYCFLG